MVKQRRVVEQARARGDSVRTTVALPRALWQQAKAFAVMEGLTLGEVIVLSVQFYMPLPPKHVRDAQKAAQARTRKAGPKR